MASSALAFPLPVGSENDVLSGIERAPSNSCSELEQCLCCRAEQTRHKKSHFANLDYRKNLITRYSIYITPTMFITFYESSGDNATDIFLDVRACFSLRIFMITSLHSPKITSCLFLFS